MEEQKILFTSDTHFYHSNIIKYCNRPFSSVEEMNNTLINNWNSVVGKSDIVYHLGDFCWKGSEKWKEIREQLNGNIILIIGNHDEHLIHKNSIKSLFQDMLFQKRIMIESYNVYLNHFPFLCYSGQNEKTVQLFGHIHSTPNLEIKSYDEQRFTNYGLPYQYDVGVDANDFRPITWEQIKIKLNIK